MHRILLVQCEVLCISPSFPGNGGVQVALPPPHALLIGPALQHCDMFWRESFGGKSLGGDIRGKALAGTLLQERPRGGAETSLPPGLLGPGDASTVLRTAQRLHCMVLLGTCDKSNVKMQLESNRCLHTVVPWIVVMTAVSKHRSSSMPMAVDHLTWFHIYTAMWPT